MTWWQGLILVAVVGTVYLLATRNWPKPPTK